VRLLAIVSCLFFSVIAHVEAQPAIEPMPDARGIDPSVARACSRSDATACITAADTCLRIGDGARANALYQRAAELARHAMRVPARPSTPGRVRTSTAAIAALEDVWARDVVRGAGAHGQRETASTAQDRVFGEHAVATWTARRATIADAFRLVHTWTLREGGAFASSVWVGQLSALAADAPPCWELRFAFMNLDFVAYLDDHGRLLAIVHLPEG
jgi:hypothetical protein